LRRKEPVDTSDKASEQTDDTKARKGTENFNSIFSPGNLQDSGESDKSN